jgi:hypothetical protein
LETSTNLGLYLLPEILPKLVVELKDLLSELGGLVLGAHTTQRPQDLRHHLVVD